jgi:uncharacterized repeat protein (TIGR04138 family)
MDREQQEIAEKNLQRVAKELQIHVEAFHFVVDALQFTVEQMGDKSGEAPRHLHAHELLDGLVHFGMKKFGLLSDTVFKQWGVKSNQDIANIVYQMIKIEMLKKSEEDDFKDFEGAPELYAAIDNCSSEIFG